MKNSFFSYLCLAVVLLSYTSAGAQQKRKISLRNNSLIY